MKLKKLLTFALPLLLLSSAVVGMAPQPTYQDFVTALNLFRGRQDTANASRLVTAYNNLNPSNQKRANQAAGPALTQAMSLINPSRQPQVDAEAQRLAQEQAAQAEAQRIAQEQAAQAEAQRIAQEQAAQAEAKRLADEQAARDAEAKRLADEKAARDAAEVEAKRLAAEQAARDAEAKRLADEKIARDAADAEAKRLAAEQAIRDAEAKRLADEKIARDAAQAEAKRLAAEQAAKDAEAKRLMQLDSIIAQIPSMSLDMLKKQIPLILQNQGNEALTRKVANAFSDAIRQFSSDKDYADVVKAFNTKIAGIKEYDLSDLQIIFIAPIPAEPVVKDLTIDEIKTLFSDDANFPDEATSITLLTQIRNSLTKSAADPDYPALVATLNNKIDYLTDDEGFRNLTNLKI